MTAIVSCIFSGGAAKVVVVRANPGKILTLTMEYIASVPCISPKKSKPTKASCEFEAQSCRSVSFFFF